MNRVIKRPDWEVAQVVRRFGNAFTTQHKMPARHWQTLWALRDCRTALLGGHIEYCGECRSIQRISYNSCRNRHCPKCGGLERELWIQAREEELLPVPYQHIVFTIPQELNMWCRYNDAFCYDLLFKAAWQTLRTFAADPRYLGAQLGATMMLHSWGQNLSLHPHVHCIVPAGGLTAKQGWKKPRRKAGFLFPVKAMSKVFKAIYLKDLMRAWNGNKLKVPPDAPLTKAEKTAWRRQRYNQAWVVYAKAPFRTPKTVVEYLGRYTHKVAISNHRITDIGDQHVRFRYKDYRQNGKQKIMQLKGTEFLRRFCLHILPQGFRRMRHYGILSNARKTEALAAARQCLGVDSPERRTRAERKAQLLEQYFPDRPKTCTHCGCIDSIRQFRFAPGGTARPPPLIIGERGK
ncbi:IS91 family transposase [Lewinella cohaerens]|uniref:IS91 family transposase n=1 Tax=Lewinella cohaerens TaxID=70995 RepID=UPI0012EC13C5